MGQRLRHGFHVLGACGRRHGEGRAAAPPVLPVLCSAWEGQCETKMCTSSLGLRKLTPPGVRVPQHAKSSVKDILRQTRRL